MGKFKGKPLIVESVAEEPEKLSGYNAIQGWVYALPKGNPQPEDGRPAILLGEEGGFSCTQLKEIINGQSTQFPPGYEIQEVTSGINLGAGAQAVGGLKILRILKSDTGEYQDVVLKLTKEGHDLRRHAKLDTAMKEAGHTDEVVPLFVSDTEDPACMWAVMPKMQCRNFADILNSLSIELQSKDEVRRLQAEWLMLDYLQQTAKILGHMHQTDVPGEQGPSPMLHLDLKPANWLLDPYTGQLRLTDFGTSKEKADIDYYSVVGTALFRSPESVALASGRPSDQVLKVQAQEGLINTTCFDTWSIGVMLGNCLSVDFAVQPLESGHEVFYAMHAAADYVSGKSQMQIQERTDQQIKEDMKSNMIAWITHSCGIKGMTYQEKQSVKDGREERIQLLQKFFYHHELQEIEAIVDKSLVSTPPSEAGSRSIENFISFLPAHIVSDARYQADELVAELQSAAEEFEKFTFVPPARYEAVYAEPRQGDKAVVLVGKAKEDPKLHAYIGLLEGILKPATPVSSSVLVADEAKSDSKEGQSPQPLLPSTQRQFDRSGREIEKLLERQKLLVGQALEAKTGKLPTPETAMERIMLGEAVHFRTVSPAGSEASHESGYRSSSASPPR